MILTTTDDIPGMKITKTLGLVRAGTTRARGLGRDILALIKNCLGGELREYTKLVAEAREQSLDRLQEEAEKLGANAIVAIRFASTEVMSGVAEIVVYGTAVRAE
ncbi:MAG: YbjQ family protein [Planctomycetota bacterium]